MSRRTNSEELGFGSDSFLDIVANIVGILIILIVIAGLRVSQAPVTTVASLTAHSDTVTAVPSVEPMTEITQELSFENNADQPKGESVERAAVAEVTLEPSIKTASSDADNDQPVTTNPPEAEPKPPEPPAELVQLAEKLETEIPQLETRTAESSASLGMTQEQQHLLEQQVAAVNDTLMAADRERLLSRNQISESTQTLQLARKNLADLTLDLEQAEREKTPAKKIEHKVTPISHHVGGKEMHFRLAQDRVSVIPLDALIARVQQQIQQRRDWLLRYGRHEGQVGPIDGFTLTYLVERKDLSVFDELQHGRGMVRIGVSEWNLNLGPDVTMETASEAVRGGSQFQRALLMADPSATLTFWVYPDSFTLYRQLQRIAQRLGFTVAARPLPFGVPIAGSPNGSRSSGQ